ncbi:hypothetical protein KYC5002_17335 [Archangium violaceum]|uniref:hypothetical protein n=1 Tax=Archangium violaceum TaxID=83451 RepID=UPI002B31661F|nr:hypothetical protein KYC5002_17335 [Archangium gephyra]
MGELPRSFPVLERIAAAEPSATKHAGSIAALGATLAARPRWAPYGASIAYRTLGRALRTSRAHPERVPPAAAAPLIALALDLALQGD